MDVIPQQPFVIIRHNLREVAGRTGHARLGLLLGGSLGSDQKKCHEEQNPPCHTMPPYVQYATHCHCPADRGAISTVPWWRSSEQFPCHRLYDTMDRGTSALPHLIDVVARASSS